MPAPRGEHRRSRDGEPDPGESRTNLDNLRQAGADALVYMGYGMLAAKGLLARHSTSWAGTRPASWALSFMFYLMGFDKFEGWVGSTSRSEQPAGRRVPRTICRAYGENPPFWPNAIPILAYDTARVLVEGLFRRRFSRAPA